MTLLRGRGKGLEVVLAERDVDESLTELQARLAERPDFYRGAAATAIFGSRVPSAEQLAALRQVLDGGGISLRALRGESPHLEDLALDAGLQYVGDASAAHLSSSARSLVADFAGARDDIAQRRKRGESSVRRPAIASPMPAAVPVLHAVEPRPNTLFHAGTLRGGQALHHAGTIVVVGDVNPGTELVATGDIVVFGRLRGVAHAGAQGDANARVYALQLDATQLRIASSIAADERTTNGAFVPEVAFVRDGRIAIVPFEDAQTLEARA